ncbi:diguanylate cyclase, partial [Klebsiella pneumoniae]
LLLCHGMVCVVGRMRDLILQLSKSSIYSTKPRYNDRYGHQAGDECLSSVAQVLKMAVRAEGDLVARYGGEEFVVVLPGVSLAHATAIAERIQQKIREAGLPHAASAVASEVTVSIGIVASDGTVPIETLIARADSALYQAKNKGRNQWSY